MNKSWREKEGINKSVVINVTEDNSAPVMVAAATATIVTQLLTAVLYGMTCNMENNEEGKIIDANNGLVKHDAASFLPYVHCHARLDKRIYNFEPIIRK